MMGSRRAAALVAAASLTAALLVVPTTTRPVDADTAAGISAGAMFRPLAPCRVVDTRDAVDHPDDSSVTVDPGRCGVPAHASAVSMTATLTDVIRPTFLTVYPTGSPRPTTSNVNALAGETRANGAIALLGAGGTFQAYSLAAADIVVDPTGYFEPASASAERSGRYRPVGPRRLEDTRQRTLAPGEVVRIPLPDGVPSDATAVAITLTTDRSVGPDFLTAYPANTPRPRTSSLNTDLWNQTRAAGLIVPVTSDGLDVYSLNGSPIIVDITGYFTGESAAAGDDGLFIATAPTRVLDTRASGTPI